MTRGGQKYFDNFWGLNKAVLGSVSDPPYYRLSLQVRVVCNRMSRLNVPIPPARVPECLSVALAPNMILSAEMGVHGPDPRDNYIRM